MRPRLAWVLMVSLLGAGCQGSGHPAAVDPGLHADFLVSPDVPIVDDPVQFTDHSNGTVATWTWDFGDGAKSDLQDPSHVFNASGTYPVSLTVANRKGATDRAVHDVIVGRPADNKTFSVDFRYNVDARTVDFEPVLHPASASVDLYHWEFGDGTGSNLSAPQHTYLEDGVYSVLLRASSNASIAEVRHDVPVGVAMKSPNLLSNRSFAVIAVVDSGINPYHSEFRDDAFTLPPSDYIDGYPSTATELDLSLNEHTYSAALKRDEATWKGVKANTLYWIPGTRIVGAISITQDGEHKVLDDDGHGTATSSDAAGATVGACPRCLIVVVEGLGEAPLQWALDQPWIDVVTNSWNLCLATCEVDTGVLPSAVVDPKATQDAVEAGKEVLFASGNGVLNGFDAPTLTYMNAYTGPDWILTVGAADAASGATIAGTGRPVDAVSYGLDWKGASAQSTNSIVPFSGTSAATPVVAGAFAAVVRDARERLGDHHEGPRHGVLALGPKAKGLLSDGALTRAEAERALLLTATSTSGVGPVYPASVPGTAAAFLYAGYGLINAQTAAQAMKVVAGDIAPPQRTNEDTWAAVDSSIRQAIWGSYDSGYSSPDGASDPALVNAWLAALGVDRADLGLT